MINYVLKKASEELLFLIVVILTLISSIFINPSIGAIQWKVVAALLSLMLVSAGLEKYHFLDKIAISILIRFKIQRNIGYAMILTTALLSMLITNDVALITIVPLTIVIAKRAGFNPLKIIVLETAAANIGSSLTPFGNPQNLYLYSFFKIPTLEFFKITLPFCLIGIISLIFINSFTDKGLLNFNKVSIKIVNPFRVAAQLMCFGTVLASIIRIADYRIVTVIILLYFLAFERRLFLNVDYFLLLTFVFFFLFIDNISRINIIQDFAQRYLNTPEQIVTFSAFLSQFISNVPTAILLSVFTPAYKYLLIGVSLGGLGTMIASLANFISYKFYIKEYDKKTYNRFFYKINITMLVILYFILMLLITIT